jgi:hypothetical protein
MKALSCSTLHEYVLIARSEPRCAAKAGDTAQSAYQRTIPGNVDSRNPESHESLKRLWR